MTMVYHLRGISPPIWRRVRVAADTTIAALHEVIQAVMGWEDIHLHQFAIRGQWYGVPREGALNLHAGSEDLELSAFNLQPRERFTYEYDFYSQWHHDIRLEQVWPNAWKKGPGSRHEMFGRLGIRCRDFRDPKDPNSTGVLAEIPDMAEFHELLQSEEGKKAMREDGLKVGTMRMLVEFTP